MTDHLRAAAAAARQTTRTPKPESVLPQSTVADDAADLAAYKNYCAADPFVRGAFYREHSEAIERGRKLDESLPPETKETK